MIARGGGGFATRKGMSDGVEECINLNISIKHFSDHSVSQACVSWKNRLKRENRVT